MHAGRARRRGLLAGAAAAMIVAAAVIGGLAATGTFDGGSSPAITPTAIAGETLGLTDSAYNSAFGISAAIIPLRYPSDYAVRTFGEPEGLGAVRVGGLEGDPEGNVQGVEIVTWNANDRTSAGIGPCSTVAALKAAYGRRAEAVASQHPGRQGVRLHGRPSVLRHGAGPRPEAESRRSRSTGTLFRSRVSTRSTPGPASSSGRDRPAEACPALARGERTRAKPAVNEDGRSVGGLDQSAAGRTDPFGAPARGHSRDDNAWRGRPPRRARPRSDRREPAFPRYRRAAAPRATRRRADGLRPGSRDAGRPWCRRAGGEAPPRLRSGRRARVPPTRARRLRTERRRRSPATGRESVPRRRPRRPESVSSSSTSSAGSRVAAIPSGAAIRISSTLWVVASRTVSPAGSPVVKAAVRTLPRSVARLASSVEAALSSSPGSATSRATMSSREGVRAS